MDIPAKLYYQFWRFYIGYLSMEEQAKQKQKQKYQVTYV